MQANDLRQKSLVDLNGLLIELRKEQFSLRMQQGTGQSIRANRIKEVRKEIARIKTVMNEQRLGIAS
jgi:large subunit ribosomal protein L29